MQIAFHKDQKNTGYTLMELAIVLAILGMMLGSALAGYNIYLAQSAIKKTNISTRYTSIALTDFLGRNGRYPCPASLTADRADPAYGRENCTVAVTPGTCVNGLCGQTGQRAGTIVRAGAIPFRELNLREEDALDGYNARLVYAVTGLLTDQTTYTINGGEIDIVDASATPKSILGAPGTADFVVLSMGPDGAGATLANGQQSTPCPAGTMETINCSFGASAIYRYDAKSTSGTDTQLDDTLAYFARGEQNPWNLMANTNHMYNKNMIPGKIGIMTDAVSTDPEIKLQAEGKARARNTLNTADVCQNDDPSTCTLAAAIGGEIDGVNDLTCPDPGEYLVGIHNNQPDCLPWKTQCPTGTLMTGIAANGAPKCEVLSCPATPVTLCSTGFTIPQGDLKDRVVIGPAGINLRKTFVCQKGTWRATRTTGTCTCTPRVVTDNVPCGPGFSGKRTIRRTWTCPANTWTGEVELSNTCRCIGSTQTRNQDCPPGQQGQITQKRTLTCPAGTWSTWTDVTNTCRTPPCGSIPPRNRTVNCPDGDTGIIRERSSWNCATNRWDPWSEISNTCTCTGTRTETRSRDCPSGQVGTIREQRTRTCGAGWGSWSETSNTCVPATGAGCRWKPLPGPGPTGSVALGERANGACPCDALPGRCYRTIFSDLYMNYPVCNCE